MVTDLLRSRHTGAVAPTAGFSKRGGALETFYPRNAICAIQDTVGAAWSWSPYVQIVAATADIWIPHIYHAEYRAATVTAGTKLMTVETEIATGAAGAEVLFSRFSETLGLYGSPTGALSLVAYGKSYPCNPFPMPPGIRFSFRVRANIADTSAICEVCLYMGGYDVTAPASFATPAWDNYLGGSVSRQLLTTPTGALLSVPCAAWGGWGAWTTIIDPAPDRLLLWGEAHNSSQNANQSRYLEFGTGAAGTEASWARLAIPGGLVPANCGQQFMRRPLLVLAGERLAVRATGIALPMNHQFLYEDLV